MNIATAGRGIHVDEGSRWQDERGEVEVVGTQWHRPFNAQPICVVLYTRPGYIGSFQLGERHFVRTFSVLPPSVEGK